MAGPCFAGADIACGVTSAIDGTARGGLIAIEQETGIPVKLVGMGEGIDDLGFFDAQSYLDALVAGVSGEASAAPA